MSARLEDVLRKVNKDLGGEVATVGFANEDCPRVPSSSPTINHMTHGGFPRGRIIEFFGPESSGKTTTAVDLVGHMASILKEEKSDKACVYVDLEQSLTQDRCETLGVDPDDLVIMKPDGLQSAEKILDAIIEMLKERVVGCFVIDSVPALVTEDEWGKGIDEEGKRGGVAKTLTRFLREATPLVARDGVLAIIINQVRDSMDPYKPFTTPGGRGLKFFSSVRMDFAKGHLLDRDGKEISGNSDLAWGNLVKVRVVKAKGFPPDRLLGQYPLMYYSGIDSELDLAMLMVAVRMATQAGSWLTVVDSDGQVVADDSGKPAKAQGLNRLADLLRANPKLRAECEKKLI